MGTLAHLFTLDASSFSSTPRRGLLQDTRGNQGKTLDLDIAALLGESLMYFITLRSKKHDVAPLTGKRIVLLYWFTRHKPCPSVTCQCQSRPRPGQLVSQQRLEIGLLLMKQTDHQHGVSCVIVISKVSCRLFRPQAPPGLAPVRRPWVPNFFLSIRALNSSGVYDFFGRFLTPLPCVKTDRAGLDEADIGVVGGRADSPFQLGGSTLVLALMGSLAVSFCTGTCGGGIAWLTRLGAEWSL